MPSRPEENAHAQVRDRKRDSRRRPASPQELQVISQKSCAVLRSLGPEIQWLQSFVTDDKIYCDYIAPNEATVRRHADQGGFPATRIFQVRRVMTRPRPNSR